MTDALAASPTDPSVKVPWAGFDLINAVNAWKRSEDAGRVFVAASDPTVTRQVTGLSWRHQVCAQVFEEAAVDLGQALAAYAKASSGSLHGRLVGFPRPKLKGRCRDRFRMGNRTSKGGWCHIRIGDGHPRSVILPVVGAIHVHDDTRRLRRHAPTR